MYSLNKRIPRPTFLLETLNLILVDEIVWGLKVTETCVIWKSSGVTKDPQPIPQLYETIHVSEFLSLITFVCKSNTPE